METIGLIDKAIEYSEELSPAYVDGDFDKYSIQQAFIDGAEWALSHQWISVEEALPEADEVVLVTTEEDPGSFFFCHRSDSPVVETDEGGWCNYTGEKIIAWMQVPKFNKK